jgi:hypothetical protein
MVLTTSLACGFTVPGVARACTLWGAAGADANGGTILSKNRDWKPDHVQTLELHRPANGFTYFGLYAVGNDAEGLKEGVNEKGLCVVTATAGSIPKATRQAEPGRSGVMSTLLQHYATCDQILADQKALFQNRKPTLLMISDRKQILVLEVGLKGRYALKAVESGTATHSNHFLDASLTNCNAHVSESSAARLARIAELLEKTPRPLDTPAFAAMSRDSQGGVNNSLWRTSSGSATLSSWIIETPRSGPPTLRVLLANPGRPEQTNTFVLTDQFWKDNRFEHHGSSEEREVKAANPSPKTR